MAATITVDIFGPKSLEEILRSQLDGKTFYRSASWTGMSQSFKFKVAADGCSFTVLVFDAASFTSFPRDMLEKVRMRSSPFCVVGNSLEPIPTGFSADSYTADDFPAHFAYHHDVKYLTVHSDGTGLDLLLSYIVATLHPLPVRRALLRWDDVVNFLLDSLARVFALPSRVSSEHALAPTLAQVQTDIANYSLSPDDWQLELMQRCGIKVPLPGSISVMRLSSHLLGKYAKPCEAMAMEYVRQNTTIPVPRLHFQDQALPMLVQDNIPGQMLHECWDSQSAIMQFRIACTLRLYVRQLQSLTSNRVGDLDNGMVTGGLFFPEDYGPFESLRHFRRWCEFVAYTGRREIQLCGTEPITINPPLPPTDGQWDLVFTHGDLNASNILLDKHNVLWVVDWGCAGFYPTQFESLHMRLYEQDDTGPWSSSWLAYRPFIAGKTSPIQEWFWDCFRDGIRRF